MSKNLIWKFAVIIVLVVLCVLEVYPPDKKLKPGIDLAGGTSLLYQIDTSGLSENELRNVAPDMIRILQQRIDPGSKKNLVWRAHGRDRLEIQMPLASQDTQIKREAYQKELDAIKSVNLDLVKVRQALVRPEGMTEKEYQQMRTNQFAALAGDSVTRKTLLMTLGEAEDAFKAAEMKRNAAIEADSAAKAALENAKVSTAAVDQLARQWDTMDEPNRIARVSQLAGDDAAKTTLITDSLQKRRELAAARQAITGETGAEAARSQAWTHLENNNIEIDRLKRILEANPDIRMKELAQLKEQYPQLGNTIDQLVKLYDEYAKVAGRLDDPEDLMRLLRGSGVLEFRILPTATASDLSDADIKVYKERLQEKGPHRASDERYVWKKVRSRDDFHAPQGSITQEFAGQLYVLASNQPREVQLHQPGGEPWRLQKSRVGTDQYGKWCVFFSFNDIGASSFLDLTKNNLQRPLAIFLDEEAISAPNIQSAIGFQGGQITGNFTQKEIQDLVDKLNAGSLPARLGDRPLSMNTIGPSMGQENLGAGLNSGKISMILVVIFMTGYYMVAGALASIAMIINVLIIIAVMAFTRATFTMPGIAGLILTLGMAVDANVLVNERIREEQTRGCSLRMAIKNGYDRAFRTILDSNVTTFIPGLFLYLLASEEVKGFALTLMIGLVANMFTALFVTRTCFDWMIDQRIVKNKLAMLRVIGIPNISWMSFRYLIFTASTIMVIGGWSVFLLRDEAKNSKYAIEFVGGTSIRVVVNDKTMSRDNVEEALQKEGERIGNDAIAAAMVQKVESQDADKNEYEIVTSETNRVDVALTLANQESMTAEQITRAIRKKAGELGDKRMTMVNVKPGPTAGTFSFETIQSNHNMIRLVLDKAVEGARYTLATRDIVSEAVRNALRGKLDVQDNLNPDVTGQPITAELISQKPYLSQYQGGLLLSASFGKGNTDTLKRLKNRFNQLRFKTEFEKYGTFNYDDKAVFSPDNTLRNENAALNGVALVVMPTDFRYDGTNSEEWTKFASNETARFKEGLALATSLPRVTQIDPSIGQKSMTSALIAIVLSFIGILIYVWVRFGDVRFSIGALLSLIHDVSVLLGLVAASAWLSKTPVGQALLISDFKIDMTIVAAFLTLVGYSLNDTVVVFDRIRENRGKGGLISPHLIDNSINQTLSRTLLTSVSVLMVVVVMYIWGGPGLRGFNFVMILGILVGTYSSIAIAAPALLFRKGGLREKTND